MIMQAFDGLPFRIVRAVGDKGVVDLPAHGEHTINISFRLGTGDHSEADLRIQIDGRGCYLQPIEGSITR